MIPTLLHGDHILVDKYIYKNNVPQRGDIIIFPYPVDPSKDFAKRLVGLEGDIIEIRDKQLYINHELYAESYIINTDPSTIPASQHPRDFFGPITIPQNSLFVMGDNRDNSHDSRFWGLVDKSTVKGKVKSLYWSWDKKAFKVRWERIGKRIEQVTF
jgi:signal peptidase I